MNPPTPIKRTTQIKVVSVITHTSPHRENGAPSLSMSEY